MTDSLLPQAVISDDRRYRYALWRETGAGTSGTVLFVMLNPSTADEEVPDKTMTRCVGFARDWNYRRMAIGNLWPLRATNWGELRWQGKYPAGEESCGIEGHAPHSRNDCWTRRLAEEASMVVAAWGANAPKVHPDREKFVRLLLQEYGPIYCLGTTKGGQPRHPLYLPKDTELEDWG
jgi:hypothetical protein